MAFRSHVDLLYRSFTAPSDLRRPFILGLNLERVVSHDSGQGSISISASRNLLMRTHYYKGFNRRDRGLCARFARRRELVPRPPLPFAGGDARALYTALRQHILDSGQPMQPASNRDATPRARLALLDELPNFPDDHLLDRFRRALDIYHLALLL